MISCSLVNPPLPAEEPVLAEWRVLLAARYSWLNASVRGALLLTHIHHFIIASRSCDLALMPLICAESFIIAL